MTSGARTRTAGPCSHGWSAPREERRRIAADLHDDTIQVMTAVGLRLQTLRQALADPAHLDRLRSLEETVGAAIARMRRLLFEFHPPELDHAGLAAALRAYLEESFDAKTVRFRIANHLQDEPPEEMRSVAFRIVQEALANVRKHASATSVEIVLEEHEGGIGIRVRDDGVGFDAEASHPRPGHLGLTTMRERAESAGGWVRITSAPRSGTTVELWLPTHDLRAA